MIIKIGDKSRTRSEETVTHFYEIETHRLRVVSIVRQRKVEIVASERVWERKPEWATPSDKSNEVWALQADTPGLYWILGEPEYLDKISL
jgi:hypothetical protein